MGGKAASYTQGEVDDAEVGAGVHIHVQVHIIVARYGKGRQAVRTPAGGGEGIRGRRRHWRAQTLDLWSPSPPSLLVSYGVAPTEAPCPVPQGRDVPSTIHANMPMMTTSSRVDASAKLTRRHPASDSHGGTGAATTGTHTSQARISDAFPQ